MAPSRWRCSSTLGRRSSQSDLAKGPGSRADSGIGMEPLQWQFRLVDAVRPDDRRCACRRRPREPLRFASSRGPPGRPPRASYLWRWAVPAGSAAPVASRTLSRGSLLIRWNRSRPDLSDRNEGDLSGCPSGSIAAFPRTAFVPGACRRCRRLPRHRPPWAGARRGLDLGGAESGHDGLNDGRGRDRHSDGDGNTRRTYDRAQLHSDGFSDRVPDSIPRPRADSPPRGPGG